MTGQTVKLTIDGREVTAEAGGSLLHAALEAGIYVPHLCDHPDLPPGGVCRLCVVEVEGVDGVVASCSTPVADGLVVTTQSDEIARLRRLAMELLLVGHPPECGTCQKYLNCELQSLKQYLGVEELRVNRRPKLLPVNGRNPLFVYDPNKCVLCGRCVRACGDLREVNVLQYKKQGSESYIYTAEGEALADSGCRFCGACAEVCPTGAIQDKEELMQDQNRKAALVPCKSTCPAEIDVPRYVRAIKEGDCATAVAVIREKVPFPLVLGLRLRASLRDRVPARPGERSRVHQGAEALRGLPRPGGNVEGELGAQGRHRQAGRRGRRRAGRPDGGLRVCGCRATRSRCSKPCPRREACSATACPSTGCPARCCRARSTRSPPPEWSSRPAPGSSRSTPSSTRATTPYWWRRVPTKGRSCACRARTARARWSA